MGNLDFSYNNQRLMGYLAEPSGPVKGGVVVIQEWWGLTPDIAAIADRYAAEGFLAWSRGLATKCPYFCNLLAQTPQSLGLGGFRSLRLDNPRTRPPTADRTHPKPCKSD